MMGRREVVFFAGDGAVIVLNYFGGDEGVK